MRTKLKDYGLSTMNCDDDENDEKEYRNNNSINIKYN